MKYLNRGATIALFLCFIVSPMGQTSVALSSNSGLLDGFTAYPKPNLKPAYECVEQEGGYETYLGQKQAVAAALGFYFGVTHANTPQIGKEKFIKYMCL